MATVPGPMVEAVSTVHMRASLSAGGTVTFIPPELQAAIDLSAFDKFLRTVPRIGFTCTTVCLCLNNSLPHRAHTRILTCTVTAGTQEELGCLTLPFFRHRLRKPEPPLALPGLSTTFHSTMFNSPRMFHSLRTHGPPAPPITSPKACGTMPQRWEIGALARPRSLPLRNWSLASAAGLMPQR